MNLSKSAIRSKINNHFDKGEFRSLCFDLEYCDVQFDNLAGETLISKIESLIGFLDRRGQLSELIKICATQRPNVEWYITSQVPEIWLVGKWTGQWHWRQTLRVAEIMIPSIPDQESQIRISYTKADSITIVDQILSVVVENDNVKLIGTGYRFVEQGKAVGYHLDKFVLQPSSDRMQLTGVKVDKRGIKVPVEFRKL